MKKVKRVHLSVPLLLQRNGHQNICRGAVLRSRQQAVYNWRGVKEDGVLKYLRTQCTVSWVNFVLLTQISWFRILLLKRCNLKTTNNMVIEGLQKSTYTVSFFYFSDELFMNQLFLEFHQIWNTSQVYLVFRINNPIFYITVNLVNVNYGPLLG